jgi:DMSO/TMAO reductase YedYZ molybdopterin-dependent catalytic subunit
MRVDWSGGWAGEQKGQAARMKQLYRTRIQRIQTRLLISLGPALIAAAASLVAMFAGRIVLGIPTPPELYGDRLTLLVPLPLFAAILGLFGTNTKHLFFYSLVAGFGVLAALLGVAYWNLRGLLAAQLAKRGRDWNPQRSPQYVEMLAVGAWLYLVSLVLVSPLVGAGFLGSSLTGGIGVALLSQLPPIAVFSLVFIPLLRRAETEQRVSSQGDAETPADAGRRQLLRQGLIALGLVGGGVALWELVSSGVASSLGLALRPRPATGLSLGNVPDRILPPPQPTYGTFADVSGQTADVTPTDQFYYVSKDLASDPTINIHSWRLKIDGAVAQPFSLTYDELKALPTQQRYHTLECISNEVGGSLMSNALFVGTSLADLLNRAGIQLGASTVIFQAADGYSDSLHLSQALDPRSLVVHTINGAALPSAHGYPARLLVPGLYGMKNGKWLTQLTVSAKDYTGYWEGAGWSREARVKMTSRIDTPLDGDTLRARPTAIAGVAFAADRGVSRVDVSVDGGKTWQVATLRRPLGDLTWVLWELPWTPASGIYTIVVRCIDLQGYVQSPVNADTLPDGASGYHNIQVAVR